MITIFWHFFFVLCNSMWPKDQKLKIAHDQLFWHFDAFFKSIVMLLNVLFLFDFVEKLEPTFVIDIYESVLLYLHTKKRITDMFISFVAFFLVWKKSINMYRLKLWYHRFIDIYETMISYIWNYETMTYYSFIYIMKLMTKQQNMWTLFG